MVKNLEKIKSRLLYPKNNSYMKNAVMRIVDVRKSSQKVGRLYDCGDLHTTDEDSLDVDVSIYFDTNYECVSGVPHHILNGNYDDLGNTETKIENSFVVVESVKSWLKYFGYPSDQPIVISEVYVCSCKSVV